MILELIMEQKEIKCPDYGIVLREADGESGSYYADFLPEYDSPEITVPEEVNGMRIIGLKCMHSPGSSVRKIRLSYAIRHLDFGLERFGCHYIEIEIDDDNPCFLSDGKAIYSKNGELIIFYAVGCSSYEVLAGTRVIKDGAFWECPNLRHIKLPSGVEEIRIRAFFKLTALRDINIPDTVRMFGKKAFFGCKRLETLNIPRSLEAVGSLAFPNSGAFREITVDADNPRFTAENGVLYSKDKTRLIFVPPKTAGNCFAVPDGVNIIGSAAFHGSPDLEEVLLPQSVSVIEHSAFYGCHFLQRINLETVKRIDDLAFASCSRLTSVELFCNELGANVFRSCHRIKTAEVNGLQSSGSTPFDENLHELVLSDDIDFTALSGIFADYRKTPYVITVRDHKTRELLYKLSGMCDSVFDAQNVTNNFRENGFDFDGYDRYFEERFGENDLIFDMTKIYASFLRLKYPRGLSENARDFYRDVLSTEAEFALVLAMEAKNFEVLPELFEVGMINEGNLTSLIDFTLNAHQTEFTAALLQIKNERFPDPFDDKLNLD